MFTRRLIGVFKQYGFDVGWLVSNTLIGNYLGWPSPNPILLQFPTYGPSFYLERHIQQYVWRTKVEGMQQCIEELKVQKFPGIAARLPNATRYDTLIPWIANSANRHFKEARRASAISVGLPPNSSIEDLYEYFKSAAAGRDRGKDVHNDSRAWAALYNAMNTWRMRFDTNLGRITDWVLSEYIDLLGDHYTIREATRSANEWHRVLEEEAELERHRRTDPPVPGRVVYYWPDGWTVQKLTNNEQKKGEGRWLGHCVGQGGYENAEIYSLRDPEGKAYATVHVDPSSIEDRVWGPRLSEGDDWDVDRTIIEQISGPLNEMPGADWKSHRSKTSDREFIALRWPEGYETIVCPKLDEFFSRYLDVDGDDWGDDFDSCDALRDRWAFDTRRDSLRWLGAPPGEGRRVGA